MYYVFSDHLLAEKCKKKGITVLKDGDNKYKTYIIPSDVEILSQDGNYLRSWRYLDSTSPSLATTHLFTRKFLDNEKLKLGMKVRIIESGQEGEVYCVCKNGNKAKVQESCYIINELELVEVHEVAFDPRTSFVEALVYCYLNEINNPSKIINVSASEINQIKREAQVRILDDEIVTTRNGTAQIDFNLSNGLYVVIIGSEEIPFHEICKGPAKAGLAQFIGHGQLYAAYKIITNWIKNYKKEERR